MTQAHIAQQVGVNIATVSLALRGDPRISAKTAGRVREAAERLGYRPDPAFAWIADARWRGGEGCRRVTLAFISQLRQPNAGSDALHRRGAEARASELGYGLDQFFLDDYPDLVALQRVLTARGIRGLIVGPFYESEPQLALDWSRFCTVICGHGHFEPRFHGVSHDPHEEILVAWRQALAYGYRRPGLVILRHPRPLAVDDDDARWSAALLCHAQGAPGGRVPPLFYTSADPREVDTARIVAWYRKWKPDAVLALNPWALYLLQQKCKAQVPGQVGFAQFASIGPRDEGIAGVKDWAESVGRASVDLLQLTLRTNQWGLPGVRIRHYVDPVWVEGDTLPRREGDPKA